MIGVTIMVLQSPISTKTAEKQASREVLRRKWREYGEQRKIRILDPKTKKLVESHIKDTACRSQSEFVEEAIRFYCGHLDVNTGEAIGYLAPVLNGMIKLR